MVQPRVKRTAAEDIADTLRETLATADPGMLRVLAEKVEDYARKFPVSYHELRQGKAPALECWLFDAIVEGSEARPVDKFADN